MRAGSARSARLGAAIGLVVLAACAGEGRSRDEELARRLDRVEASLERLADDQTLGRGQIDQLRAELAAVRAQLDAPPAPPPVRRRPRAAAPDRRAA